ncbi:MAG: suhB [Alphaproteobacteria bacterium]|nr:suhB [Alphaproteobacteria bacterium]
MALSPNLSVIERAIEKASRSLVRDFNEVEKLQISVKGPGDFVSKADRRAEELLVESLRRDRPDWGFMGEEGTSEKGKDERYRFIIDPLDGTENFLHGIPQWSVTVALEKEGEIVAGMTFDPVRQEMFRVEKGTGAFMNHTRLRVSGRKEVLNTVVALDIGRPVNEPERVTVFTDILQKAYLNGATTRLTAGAALDLAYVAAGRYDAYYLLGGAKPWDVATGLLLVREAGGIVTDLSLKPTHHTEAGAMLATTVGLQKKLLEKLGLGR